MKSELVSVRTVHGLMLVGIPAIGVPAIPFFILMGGNPVPIPLLVVAGALIAVVLVRLASLRVTATKQHLVIRNLFYTSTVPWREIKRVGRYRGRMGETPYIGVENNRRVTLQAITAGFGTSSSVGEWINGIERDLGEPESANVMRQMLSVKPDSTSEVLARYARALNPDTWISAAKRKLAGEE